MVEVPQTASVNVGVELFGQARLLADRREVEVTVPEHPHPGDVVAALADALPELVGKVIRDDGSGLLESYIFNLNGIVFVGEERVHLKPGDHLLLFSSQAGG